MGATYFARSPGTPSTWDNVAFIECTVGPLIAQALGHNPFAPIVPCHRVLGAGNTGVGFSATGGVDTKLKMLEIEHAQLGAHRGLFD